VIQLAESGKSAILRNNVRNGSSDSNQGFSL
jgi:hypothetical protein